MILKYKMPPTRHVYVFYIVIQLWNLTLTNIKSCESVYCIRIQKLKRSEQKTVYSTSCISKRPLNFEHFLKLTSFCRSTTSVENDDGSSVDIKMQYTVLPPVTHDITSIVEQPEIKEGETSQIYILL